MSGKPQDSSASRSGILPAAGAALAVAAGAVTAYALAVEPYRLEVTHTDIHCPRLPAAWDGVTILLLADLHMSRWGRRERLLASILDDLPTPDIAVLAGDLLQGITGAPPTVELIETHVRARYARYGILGNSEHKLKTRHRLRAVQAFRDAGVIMLINENTTLTVKGETVTVAGTDDPYFGHADLPATLSGIDPRQFCLLLAHSPQVAIRAARAGADLLLSGHTHGGQVRFPFIGALDTHNALGRQVDQGLFDRTRLRATTGREPGSDLMLYITRGVGVANFTRWPIRPRFLCRPEIAWLTLRKG